MFNELITDVHISIISCRLHLHCERQLTQEDIISFCEW
jgi:hypothetical protein